jgi:hypothetical protein
MWTINLDKYIIYEAENGKHRIENVQQLRPKLIIRNDDFFLNGYQFSSGIKNQNKFTYPVLLIYKRET